MSESAGSTSNAGTAGTSGGEASTRASRSHGSESEATRVAEKSSETNPLDSKETETKKESTKKEDKPEEAVSEEKKPVHKFAERLTKVFPDRKFEKDEDYDTALEEHLTNLEGYRERGQKANQKLISLFESDPSIGEVVRDMINGASFREALARHIGPDDLTPTEGDPDYEGWKKNITEREEKAKKRRDFEKQYSDNLDLSYKEIETWAKENNLDENGVTDLLGKIDALLDEINNGKITKDALNRLKKAFDYDKDVQKAEEEGRIKGRNEKIVAKKESPEKTGDGLPRPNKAPDSPKETSKPEIASYLEGLRRKIAEKEIN